MSVRLTLEAVPGIPLVEPGDDLARIITDAIRVSGSSLVDGDVVVIAQKVVSKAEGRYAYFKDVVPSDRALAIAEEVGKLPHLVELILQESRSLVRKAPGVLIVEHRLGFVMANAGIDESNIGQTPNGHRVLLLPENPDESCNKLKAHFDREFSANIGVIVNDSFGRPWRNGVVGVALGAAGVPSLRNMIGEPDLFGRTMQVTEIAVADEMAAAASLVMGQGAEGMPVVVLRGFETKFQARPATDLIRSKTRDLFR